MHDLVGIIRTAPEMEQALQRIAALKDRVANLSVEGHRQYNPGWHLALDLPHMLLVSECIARAALERRESRGGEPRRHLPAHHAAGGENNPIFPRETHGSGRLTPPPPPPEPGQAPP